jgi:dipeptidyl aminopeptidase/acylaminoacyl peptidase
MRPTDLSLLRVPGVPAVSPDGQTAVVAVTRLDLDADEYRSQLWTVPTDGSSPARPLTHGHADSAPAFSPDGRWLAYLSAEPKGRPQLHVLAVGGGQSRRLTDHHLGAGAAVWSPDSSRLAYTARVAEPGRYGTADDVPPAAEAPRLITTLKYRQDSLGFTTDRRSHVFVVDLPAEDDDAVPVPVPVQVTTGDVDDSDVTWSPDGAELAFVSARHDRADTDLVSDVYLVRTDGSHLRRVTVGRSSCAQPAFTPDGRTIYLTAQVDLGESGRDFVGRNSTLARVGVAGGDLEAVLDPETHDRGDETPATVVADGAVFFGVQRKGAVELLRVPLDGGEPEALVDGPFTVRGIGVGGGVVVATVAHDRSAGELIAITPGRRRLLTGFGAPLQSTGRLHRMRERTATAPDGYPVHGWVTAPPGPGPHPVLLTVHGGPFSQYGWTLFDETQAYVEAGYAVLQCNPRGSSGYGQAHGRVIKEHMGELDAADVLAFLDEALTDPALDSSRVGLMGGSYGGFMTTLLLGRTDRFTAGVSERAFNDPVSFVGSSDIGFFFADEYVGTDPERIAAQSPMASAHRITTPTLVIHSEEDWRCPLEQGTRLYVELKRRGVETELLLFPGEGHELSRTGRPRHRLARLEHVLRWWARWLPTAQNSAAVAELPAAPEPAAPEPAADEPAGDRPEDAAEPAAAAVDGEASGRRADTLTVPATRL